MKLWVKLLGLTLGIVTITGVAATIRKFKNDETIRLVNSTKSEEKKQSTQLVIASSSNKVDKPKSVSDTLRLLTPRDSDFNSVLDAEYPQLRTNLGTDDLRSKLIIARNQTDKPIRAFVIKWTLQAKGQEPAVRFQTYMKQQSETVHFTGGMVLAPGDARLLSPWFSLNKSQFANIKSTNASSEALNAFLNANLPDHAADIKVVQSSVDGVIVGTPPNADFIGPDESKLQDRFESERNGQHDEGVSIAHALRDKASDQAISDKLKEHIQRGASLEGRTDRESLYQVARSKQAQKFLEILEQGGRSKLEEMVTKATRISRTLL
jgi:hypothetical protein